MRHLFIFFCLCFASIFISCGDGNENSELLLTNSNIAGTFTIESLTGEENETATSTTGAVVDLATSFLLGDTFQVNLTINANGTYAIEGLYREVKTTTPNGGSTSEITSILTTDTTGNYQLNGIENTITFTANTGAFLVGTYTVNTLSQNRLSISKNSEESLGSNTIRRKIIIDFIRD